MRHGRSDLTSSYPVRHSPGLSRKPACRISQIPTTADEGTGVGPGLVRLVPASTIRLAHRQSAISAIWRVHAVYLTSVDVCCEAAVLVGLAPGWSTDSDKDRPSRVRIGWLDSRTSSSHRVPTVLCPCDCACRQPFRLGDPSCVRVRQTSNGADVICRRERALRVLCWEAVSRGDRGVVCVMWDVVAAPSNSKLLYRAARRRS
jgi:hypothetical protein